MKMLNMLRNCLEGCIKVAMTEKRATVTAPIVRELAIAGAIEAAIVRMDENGHGLVAVVRTAAGERLLTAARTGVRYFQSVDGAISALQACGLSKFVVDASGWLSRTKKRGKQAILEM